MNSGAPESAARPASGTVIRFDRHEWAGAFGDLGTLVPFLLAYVTLVGLAPAGMLLGFGIARMIVMANSISATRGVSWGCASR